MSVSFRTTAKKHGQLHDWENNPFRILTLDHHGSCFNINKNKNKLLHLL